MAVRIIAVAKQLPKYSRETKEIIPFVKLWMQDQDERFQRKVIKLFEGAGVDKRYSIMSPEEVFTATSFEEKNNIYINEVVRLAEKSLKKSLLKAGLKATDLDYIITVSCTGIMIPSLDAYLINSLNDFRIFYFVQDRAYGRCYLCAIRHLFQFFASYCRCFTVWG